MSNIPFVDLKAQYAAYKSGIDKAIQSVVDSAAFIMGPAVSELESALCTFSGAKHAIACGNGTDALQLALMAIGIKPGDEVITTPFTFIATGEMIALLKAKPVFVDIEPDTFNIDAKKIKAAITSKTKAIIPVSLYGQPADMDEINQISDAASKEYGHDVFVIEDAAQSFGASYKGKKSGNLSKLATTSFFPAKPLGGYGDGGAVFTSCPSLAKKIKSLVVHGQTKRYHHEYLGVNARMDTIQAAIVLEKLKFFGDEVGRRQDNARKYSQAFIEHALKVDLPLVKEGRSSTYAQYTIRVEGRDDLRARLSEAGIPTAIHYPTPLHMQPCFAYLGYKLGDFPLAEKAANEVLSLPMCAFLKEENITRVVEAVKQTYAIGV
jgi:UDP-2-acetamido-2-deoxy-ribo-hexuluronate aminotransferase